MFVRSLKRLHFDRFKLKFRINKLRKMKTAKKLTNGDFDVNENVQKARQSPWKVEVRSSPRDSAIEEPPMIEDVVDETGEGDSSEMDEFIEDFSEFSAPRENSFYDDWLRRFECSDRSESGDEDLDISFVEYEGSQTDLSDSVVVNPSDSFEFNGDDRVLEENNGTDQKVDAENEDKPEVDYEEEEVSKYNDEESEHKERLSNNELCRFYALNDQVFALSLIHPASLAIRGTICIKVVSGRILIGGYVLDKTRTDYVKVFSIDKLGVESVTAMPHENNSTDLKSLRKVLLENGASEPVVVSLSKVKGAIVLFRKLDYRRNTYLNYVYTNRIFNLKSSSLNDFHRLPCKRYGCNLSFLNVGRLIQNCQWNDIVTNILDHMKNRVETPRIVVCGAKGVGKSTLCRYIANCLLNESETVSWLDCDPGQTEFTPPGLLSLVDVNEPILGAPFAHQKEPRMMLFAGGISVGDSPSHYVSCVKQLVDCRNESEHQRPLIVNTMGWTTGIGLTILTDICNLVKPTHIINIIGATQNENRFKDLTVDNLSIVTGWKFETTEKSCPAEYFEIDAVDRPAKVTVSKAMRDMSLASYLSRLQSDDDPFRPINKCPCYRVPWSSVALHVCHKNVLLSEIFYVYNGNTVALCHCDPEEFVSTSDPTLPKFLKSTPVVDCFGYGIVRAISMKEKCFYIITPVSTDVLNRTNAMLIGGGLNIPVSILMKQSVNCHIPYLSAPGTDGAFGIMGSHVQRLNGRSPGNTLQTPHI